jgi:bacteriocin resistance YdeI/OmpD-like protein/uncharacterized protein DUF1905
MRFRTTILQNGKTATGIRVPAEVMAALGPSRRPPVRVTINGHTYRTTVATMGGDPMFGVSAVVREAAGVAGGDEVDVDIEVDSEPRVVSAPDDLAAALDADPQAGRFFEALSYSHKSAYVQWIESAKRDDTRRRRVEEAVRMLREGRKQR